MASSHSNILAQNPSNRSKEISLFTKKVNLKNDDQDLYEKRDRSFTFVKTEKYKYMTINEIYNLYPVKSPKTVFMYGIIVAFNHHNCELLLKDETYYRFSLCFNPTYTSPILKEIGKFFEKSLTFFVGDVIRIHRLILYNGLQRKCDNVKNAVVFDSFNEQFFTPKYLSKNPTFSRFDYSRVKHLIQWNSYQLLTPLVVENYNRKIWNLTGAFQVISSFLYHNRIVVALWNGNQDPSEAYPSRKMLTLDYINAQLSSINLDGIYSSRYITFLYSNEKITFVTLFGDVNIILANFVQPLNYIVLYGVNIKPYDSNDKFCYTINVEQGYNRNVRKVHSNSYLGIRLREKINAFSTISNELFSKTIHVKRSLKMDDKNKMIKLTNVSHFNENLYDEIEDIELDQVQICNFTCNHLQLDSYQKDIIFKYLFAKLNNPYSNYVQIHSVYSLSDLRAPGSSNLVTFKLYGQFVKCININEDGFSSDCIWIQCSMCTFASRLVSYNLLRGSNITNDFVNNLRTKFKETNIHCSDCDMDSYILTFKPLFVIRDCEQRMIIAQVNVQNENLMTVNHKENISDSLTTIFNRFHTIISYLHHISNEMTECNSSIVWTLIRKVTYKNEYGMINNYSYEIVDWSLPPSVTMGVNIM